jgi:hypothetical protein
MVLEHQRLVPFAVVPLKPYMALVLAMQPLLQNF